MELKLRQIGSSMTKPASIIELVIESDNVRLSETITKLNGRVDENLITTLRQIADDLEEQNKKLDFSWV